MNIKSLLATVSILTAATSTVALADASFSVNAHGSVRIGTPASNYNYGTGPTVRDHRNDTGPTVRDHRTQPAPVVVRSPKRYLPTAMKFQSRPPQTRPWEPQLIVSNPRIDTAAQFSFYTGSIGTVNTSWRAGFVAITQPTRIESGREHFDVSSAGMVNTLKFQAVAGTTSFTNINVMFSDGTNQMFAVNQTLDARNPMVTLDLRGPARQILWINVNGNSGAGSAYQILGSS